MEPVSNLSRRSFLKVGATVGGLVLGFPFPGLAGPEKEERASAAAFAPNLWLRVGSDDIVTVTVCQSELGQGIMTALPMLVAEELDADWSKVRIEQALADAAFYRPDGVGEQSTNSSKSVMSFWKPLRQAGAVARAMLVTAAAETWGVAEERCYTENGEVIQRSTGRRLSYGALAEKASHLPVPEQVSLKPAQNFRFLGKPMARRDIPEKVNGQAEFGIDVKRPGMLIATITRCPVYGGRVARCDASKAKAVPGVRHVLELPGFQMVSGPFLWDEPGSRIAVVADTFWAARLGQQKLEITWDEGPLATLSSAEISQRFAKYAEREGSVARREGNVGKALASAPRKLEAVYELPYLAHAPMEPMNCTAEVRKDSCEVWVPTQGQTRAHQLSSQLTGLPLEAIKVHTPYVGGGFGRRGGQDFTGDAVQLSKALGVPVKVIWTREEDIQHDHYHPATYHRISAALDEKGMPVGWKHRIVGSSIFARVSPSKLKNGLDPVNLMGASDVPYSFPNLQVEYTMHNPGIPVWYWRGVGVYTNAFVTESFIDELAAAAGQDPYEFRRRLLDKAPRHKGVLELAAAKAGWGRPLPPGRFRGIAVAFSHGSYAAIVAEISLSKEGKLRVHRVVCALDCGSVINPDTIQAQMEGGIVWGLTAVLKGEITIQGGRVKQSNFHDYPVLRMNEMPEVEVYIVPSTEAPGGVGEESVPVIGPAVANAIFAATGKRIRRLPIRTNDLRVS